MKLAIRTSSGPYAVGLFDQDHNLLAQKCSEEGGLIRSTLAALFHGCLQEASQTKDCITEIVVDLGPGGLSSTRVGVSFANALSYGMHLKLFGASALRMQMHDVRENLSYPILSMRPGPGGKSIWALFNGSVLAASGTGLPNEVIAGNLALSEKLIVVGPLKRLQLTTEIHGTCLINIDPPSLESMLKCPKIHPHVDESVCFLEPTNSVVGASR